MASQWRTKMSLCGGFVLSAVFTPAVRADLEITQDIAFNAVGRNPYSNAPAWEFGDTVTLFDESFRANIPPFNANPTQIAVEALADALGVPLPDLIKARVGASVAAQANVSFGYYVTAGRLDIAYPAGSSLRLQTAAEGDFVVTNNSYAIGADFLPGAERTIPINLAGVAGAGYLGDPLQGVSFNAYDQPKFATTSPWASAWLDASADVHGSVFTSVSALGGLLQARKDFRVDGDVGGRLVEIDPTGLYVAGEQVFGYDIHQPIGPIPIGGNAAQLEITIPKLALASNTPAPGTSVVTARAVKEVLALQGNMEKLIPFIGPILQNSLGPFEYDLLQLKGGPVVSLTQEMTFTPDPRVRLQFSEPVLVRGADGEFHQTFDHEFALNQEGQPVAPIEWLPMFSNSNQITITPTYILDNTFRNRTGLQFDIEVNVEALSLDTPFPAPLDRIPHLVNETVTIPIDEFELFETPAFQIDIPDVTARPITIEKRNVPLSIGAVGDLTLFSATSGGADANGNDIMNLVFVREFAGGEIRQYQTTVVGDSTFLAAPGADSENQYGSDLFLALADVVLNDPVTLEQINVGKNFCTGGCDWSSDLPDASPYYSDQPDPNLLGFDPIYVSVLPNLPETDINPVNHPELGTNNTYHITDVVDTEFPTESIDFRTGPATTVLVRNKEFLPEGDGEFGASFTGIGLTDAGAVAFNSTLTVFDAPVSVNGYYAIGDTGGNKLIRAGDPVPGGGNLAPNGNTVSRSINNETGEIAFIADIVTEDSSPLRRSILRSDVNETVEIVRQGQSAPDGGGTFQRLSFPIINNVGQVVFYSEVNHPSTGSKESLYRGDGQVLAKIVREGDSAPGFATPISSIGNYSLNSSGQVAFDAFSTSEVQGVFIGGGTQLTKVAVGGEAAPQGGQFLAFYDQALNETGQVAVAAGIQSAPGGNELYGIFRGDGASLVQIARQGQLAPDQDGTLKDVGLFTFQLNDAGQVVFRGQVDAATDYQAIFVGDGGALTQIARRGTYLPDGVNQFTTFGGNAQLNDRGQVAFGGNFGMGDDAESGVFLHDGYELVEVVRTGQALAGSTVASASLADLNNEMQVAYRANLEDGRSVIARFEPRLYWRSVGDGQWSTAANWSLDMAPRTPWEAYVIGENPTTVTGPTTDQTVKSLTLGGDDAADTTLNLVQGAALSATKGTLIRAHGILSGYGSLGGHVTSSGIIRVGDAGTAPATAMAIAGDLLLEAGSRLELDLHGTSQFDKLTTTGATLVEGELAVALGSFTPTLGSVFEILTAAGGVSGQFDMTVTELPELLAGLGWLVDYDADRVTLQVVVETPGDFSSNGVVGPEDLAVWTANYGSTENLSADANADGIVDGVDFLTWQRRLGSALASSSTTIPEPATILLLIVAAVGLRGMGGPMRQQPINA